MGAFGRTPTIKNLTLTTQNTEYSYVLLTGTKKFNIRCRTDPDDSSISDDMKLAYAENMSGIEYIAISEGAEHFEDGINTAPGLTVYLQSPTAGVVAEIVSWAT